jgi:hypothetical protein
VNLFDLSIAGSIVCTLIFFGVAAVVWVVRRPQPAPELTATSDLGPESPAVANLLANGGRVTPDAVPATLFDLAARRTVRIEEAEPGQYQCRLGDGAVGAMTPYEARVLELLRKRASGGVVPAQALTAGPSDEAKGWMKSFRREVVGEASAAGKCEPRWPRRVLGLMGLLVLGALWLGVAGGNEDDSLTIPQAIAIGLALAAGIVMAQAFTEDVQMVTPSGAVARGRWLSLRKYLHEDELFSDLPPTAVAVRDRYLAYGAALGVAAAAVRAIPMGAESDRWAWTNYGGGWRQVRVSYPERWPPAWGSSPWDIGWTGLWMTGIGGLAFWVSTQVLPGIDLGRDADSITRYVSLGVVAVTLAAAAAIGLGLAVLCAAVVALLVKRSVTGEAIRLRRFGDDDGFRHYLAVYEGKGDRVRAWRIRSELYSGLREYSKVLVTVSPLTGYVLAVQPA